MTLTDISIVISVLAMGITLGTYLSQNQASSHISGGNLIMKRKRMSRRKSKRSFRKGAKSNPKNMRSRPMRGGWRL